MKVTHVEFSENEKSFICDSIVALAVSDAASQEKDGQDFIIDKEVLPFLGENWISVNVKLSVDCSEVQGFDPERLHPVEVSVDSVSVNSLTFALISNNGEEIKTNLDYSFEELVKKNIINELLSE